MSDRLLLLALLLLLLPCRGAGTVTECSAWQWNGSKDKPALTLSRPSPIQTCNASVEAGCYSIYPDKPVKAEGSKQPLEQTELILAGLKFALGGCIEKAEEEGSNIIEKKVSLSPKCKKPKQEFCADGTIEFKLKSDPSVKFTILGIICCCPHKKCNSANSAQKVTLMFEATRPICDGTPCKQGLDVCSSEANIGTKPGPYSCAASNSTDCSSDLDKLVYTHYDKGTTCFQKGDKVMCCCKYPLCKSKDLPDSVKDGVKTIGAGGKESGSGGGGSQPGSGGGSANSEGSQTAECSNSNIGLIVGMSVLGGLLLVSFAANIYLIIKNRKKPTGPAKSTPTGEGTDQPAGDTPMAETVRQQTVKGATQEPLSVNSTVKEREPSVAVFSFPPQEPTIVGEQSTLETRDQQMTTDTQMTQVSPFQK